MARSKGIIKVNGMLDGISFYVRNGKETARIPNAPDKNKIQNSPSFKRTRENNQEFGGAANAGKALRVGLAQVYKHMSDSQSNARILKLTRDMINKDNGLRGQRSFHPRPYAHMLHNFSFNEQLSFDSVFIAPFSSAVNAERSEVKITVPVFSTGDMIRAPRGATHMRLVNALTVWSSFQYDNQVNKYEPVDVFNSSKSALQGSDYILLAGQTESEIVLTAAISGLTELNETSALISCIGIEFYQELSGIMYLLSSGNTMKVQGVY